MKLAVVFEETGAYSFRERKKAERGESGRSSGLQDGFEEDFEFGAEDDNDYWSGTDLID